MDDPRLARLSGIEDKARAYCITFGYIRRFGRQSVTHAHWELMETQYQELCRALGIVPEIVRAPTEHNAQEGQEEPS